MAELDPITLHAILQRVPIGAKVLDLGCGNGSLLAMLRDQRQVTGYGIDIAFENILACTEKGIAAFQGNLEADISQISTAAYDVVLLSQTLQEIQNPVRLLREVTRIGKKAIVTFPNFGYWENRLQLLLGHAPKNKSLPYEWYNTPNIRVVTIVDFKQACRENGIDISEDVALTHSFGSSSWFPRCFSNLFLKKGFFVISRSGSC